MATKETKIEYSEDKRLENTPFNVVTKVDEQENVEVLTLIGNHVIAREKCGQNEGYQGKLAKEKQLEDIEKKDWKLILNSICVLIETYNKEGK